MFSQWPRLYGLLWGPAGWGRSDQHSLRRTWGDWLLWSLLRTRLSDRIPPTTLICHHGSQTSDTGTSIQAFLWEGEVFMTWGRHTPGENTVVWTVVQVLKKISNSHSWEERESWKNETQIFNYLPFLMLLHINRKISFFKKTKTKTHEYL